MPEELGLEQCKEEEEEEEEEEEGDHLGSIVDSIEPGATWLVEVVVGGGRAHRELLGKVGVSLGGSCELVEDVVVPLQLRLVGDPRLLQQVVLDKYCKSPMAGGQYRKIWYFPSSK